MMREMAILGLYALQNGFMGFERSGLFYDEFSGDRVRIPIACWLVCTSDAMILFDTGLSPRAVPGLLRSDPLARFTEEDLLVHRLDLVGLEPDNVDMVVLSHLHFDHCGRNTVRRGTGIVATFPKAKYYVQHGEWEHAHQNQRDAVSYLSDNYDHLVESGQMQLMHGSQEIAPGISVRVLPGHTRDMQAVIIQSGGKTACYISDLIPTSAHLELNWVMAFDLYPLETIESRKSYYSQAIPGKWLTMFTHDPEILWAYIERDDRGKMRARTIP